MKKSIGRAVCYSPLTNESPVSTEFKTIFCLLIYLGSGIFSRAKPFRCKRRTRSLVEELKHVHVKVVSVHKEFQKGHRTFLGKFVLVNQESWCIKSTWDEKKCIPAIRRGFHDPGRTSETRYIIFSCYFKNTAEYFKNPGGSNQRGTRRNVFQRFEEVFMIQEGLWRRGTLFFHAISRTLLNISRILVDKINVGREERYFSDSQSFSWSRKDFGDDIQYFLCYLKNIAEYFKNPAG
ncbi:hypothetical protein JTB14_038314 [Gonioctena quinquepunctata]|nr:hypothetical protein JTB14_038314 [Gonioctena quinquepunctata]